MQRCAVLVIALALISALGEEAAPTCPGDLTTCPPLPDCWQAPTVIESVATGWEGTCEGLVRQAVGMTAEACGAACKADLNCAVWQFSGEGETAGAHCDMGVPSKACRKRDGFSANAGERIQHGAVKHVSDALGAEVMNLMSFEMVTGTEAEEEARCKQACYTDLTCGVWQYGEKVANSGKGCWMEHIAITGTTNKAGELKTDTAFAADVKAGEFIAHYCPPPPKKPETPWMWIIIGIVAGVIALGGILYFLLKPKPKVKKTRAVKIAQPEEPFVPLFIPQPTMLIPQALVQQAPVVQYQQVTQAAPMMYQQAPVVQYQQPMTAVTQPLMGSVVMR